jgi:bifunctional enzyme CysN/CysC
VLTDLNLIASDIDAYLEAHQHKDLLRFITCGSVDDGKSTLLGRMLYEAHLVFDDHISALTADSKKSGTQGEELDLALLLDGLQAEREQGITIDVAYRFFSTERRKFIVADTPGHEQYTRNMVTGASTADLAVILVDARHGVLTQTRRHSYLVSLLGISHVVLAVNKMDLVGFDQRAFETIVDEYRLFAKELGFANIEAIPVSALRGDNVIERSAETPWFIGPTLFEHLETVNVHRQINSGFRLPVQWVNRPNLNFRGFSGSVVTGIIAPGDEIAVAPSGQRSRVERIVTMDGDLDFAMRGQSVTITLEHEIDISRGDVLYAPDNPPVIADRLDTHVVWMHEQPLSVGRRYLIKTGTRTVAGIFEQPNYRVNINSLLHEPAEALNMNDVGRVVVQLDRVVAIDAYTTNRETGSFIVIDPVTDSTVGAGIVVGRASLERNVHWHGTALSGVARASLNGHKPAVVWLTGLSGSGKSTIANEVERCLHRYGMRTYLLDGDNVRHGLNHDLGFSEADRTENVRRVSEVAALMADAGLIVICALISPFRVDRDAARSRTTCGEFFEVHIDSSLAVAESRDPKGLYRKARAGELTGMTGIDSPYEVPTAPDLRIDSAASSVDEAAQQVIAMLRNANVFNDAVIGDAVSVSNDAVSNDAVSNDAVSDTAVSNNAVSKDEVSK